MTDQQAIAADAATQKDPAQSTQPGESLLGRIRLLCAMLVSVLIFWYVGWRVMAPLDPNGPVTLLLVDSGVVAMAQMLGLAIVAGGLAVAICGAGSAERGPLAIAVGLAAMGLRGGQLDDLVLYRMFPPGADPVLPDPYPTTSLMAECWLWLALIAVGFVVGRWVESWFGPTPQPANPGRRATDDKSPDVRQIAGAVVLATLVAWSLLSFAAGTVEASILKGQIYFSICVSFLIACLVAHWFFKIHTRTWSLVVVALVASAAYMLAGPGGPDLEHARQTGTYITLAPLARALPIEYAALGAVGVLWEKDWMRGLRALFGLSPEPKSDDT